MIKRKRGKGLETVTLVKGRFAYSQSIIDQGCFEPLDQYLGNTQFMDLEDLWPQVMRRKRTKMSKCRFP